MVEIYHTINLQKKLNYFFGKKIKKKKIWCCYREITKLTFVGDLDRWVGV